MPTWGAASNTMFQSLLSWIGRVNFGTQGEHVPRAGFNPCCRGSASRRHPARAGLRTGVSILVVVDQSRQRLRRGRRPRPDVSILVVVDHGSRRQRRGMPRVAQKFQSLLSWISLRLNKSSGLCLRPLWVSILVVVDWSRQLGPHSSTIPEGESFNPCCRGSARVNSQSPRVALIRFQSLLSWISLASTTCRGDVGVLDDVSILVVVDQPRVFGLSVRRPCCFNPCCRGSGRVGGIRHRTMVSILVVVDQPRVNDRPG